jgi:sarcosine oxidase subunit beta
MNECADIIIIGGGIHGASLAFHLAGYGLRPLVLERKTLAAEATGRSSGLVRMHYDLEPESRLAWESFQYFRDWEARVGGDCGFRRTGFLQFVGPEYIPALRANIAMHQRLGIPSLLVTGEDVRRLAPAMEVGDIEFAAYEPESGYADPSSTTGSLMAAARQRGARLMQGCKVTGIKTYGGRVQGVQTTQGEFSACVVVDAAGAWAGEVARMAEVDVPITTWRHDTMFIRRPPELRLGHPTVIDFPKVIYFRPETGGLTLVGLEEGNVQGETPPEGEAVPDPGFVERAVEQICKRIPAMENGSFHSSLRGYDGITPDQRPVLGQAGPDGFYLCCGFSGTGFKIGPAVGACMAELIVDGRSRTVDISSFNPGRFDRGDLLQGEHAYENIWR